MTAEIERVHQESEGWSAETPAFDVPESYWQQLISALSSGKVDDAPGKWIVLGDLEIKQLNGKVTHVSLYWLEGNSEGAFAVGPTFENRVYYRGGNSRELLQLLRAAYEAGKSEINSASVRDRVSNPNNPSHTRLISMNQWATPR